MTEQATGNNSQTLPLITHLLELRDRLLRSVMVIVVIFLSLIYFANDLYVLLADPLVRNLPKGATMIATDLTSPLFTPIKLTLVLSVFAAMPYLLSQIWAFIAPGLYKHERRLIMPLVFSSALLFYGGIAFAYFVVFPVAFPFFTSVAPDGVNIATDISSYLDLVLKLFFAFGLAFEIPIATVLLCWSGATTPDKLRASRAYVIVGVFVVGMLLTPPDVISQTLLAVPMWLLFEVGLFLSKYYVKQGSKPESTNTESYTDAD